MPVKSIFTNKNYNDWLLDLESKLGATSVSKAKERQSVSASFLDSIRSIIHGKAKYSSVEEAVEDYAKRTGLDNYLKKANESKVTNKIASNVVKVANLNPLDTVNKMYPDIRMAKFAGGKTDKLEKIATYLMRGGYYNQDTLINEASLEIDELVNCGKLSEISAGTFLAGIYALNKSNIKKNANIDTIKTNSNSFPECLKEYNVQDNFDTILDNILKSTNPIHVNIQSIQHKLYSALSRPFRIPRENIFNREVAEYINNKIINAITHVDKNDLRNYGKIDNIDFEELYAENNDAFSGLMPAKL